MPVQTDVVGFAVAALDEPVLVAGEAGIVVRAGEGHEPDARRQPEPPDRVGGGLHPVGIRPLGVVLREVLRRAVAADAQLPVAVDLYELEAVGLEGLRGELGQLDDVLLVRGAAVLLRVVRAIAARQRGQLDRITPGDGVRPGLQPQPRVVEPAEDKGLRIGALPGQDPQAAIVDPRVEANLPMVDLREHDAVAAIVREPAADDAVAALRVGHRHPGVAAGVAVRGGQAAGPQGLPVPGYAAQIHIDGKQRQPVDHLRLGPAIDQFRSEGHKGIVRGEYDPVSSAVGIVHHDSLTRARNHPGSPMAACKLAADNERPLGADARNRELPLARIENDLERLVADLQRPLGRLHGKPGPQEQGQCRRCQNQLRSQRGRRLHG